MSEQWYTVDGEGHVPGIEAVLPPGRVLLDDQGMMIDHEWATIEEQETPPIEEAQPQVEEPASSGG
jgi:hypothetical protein